MLNLKMINKLYRKAIGEKDTRIKTIHIYEGWSQNKREKFMIELYKKLLCNDPSFHFFYEPEIIIRSRNKRTIGFLKNYLDNRHILYAVYNYPDKNDPPEFYGDPPKSITVKYLEEFMQVYHAIAVFQLTAKTKEIPEIRAKIMHGCFNMDNKGYEYEAQAYIQRAFNYAKLVGYLQGKEENERNKNVS